jgi:hypothetical protein
MGYSRSTARGVASRQHTPPPRLPRSGRPAPGVSPHGFWPPGLRPTGSRRFAARLLGSRAPADRLPAFHRATSGLPGSGRPARGVSLCDVWPPGSPHPASRPRGPRLPVPTSRLAAPASRLPPPASRLPPRRADRAPSRRKRRSATSPRAMQRMAHGGGRRRMTCTAVTSSRACLQPTLSGGRFVHYQKPQLPVRSTYAPRRMFVRACARITSQRFPVRRYSSP